MFLQAFTHGTASIDEFNNNDSRRTASSSECANRQMSCEYVMYLQSLINNELVTILDRLKVPQHGGRILVSPLLELNRASIQ